MPSIRVAKAWAVRLAGVLVVRGETRIGIERRMHRVVREIEEEGLAGLHRLGDTRLGLDGQRLGEEGLGAVILLQARHGAPGRLVPLP